MTLNFEMDLNLTVVERTTQTLLDVFGAIGGLESILLTFAAIITGFFNYNNFDSTLAAKLFKMNNGQGTPVRLSPTKALNLVDYILDCLPSRCVCCRRSKNHRALEIARESLLREIDIVELIRQLRYFRAALAELVPETKRQAHLTNAKFYVISLEERDETAKHVGLEFSDLKPAPDDNDTVKLDSERQPDPESFNVPRLKKHKLESDVDADAERSRRKLIPKESSRNRAKSLKG